MGWGSESTSIVFDKALLLLPGQGCKGQQHGFLAKSIGVILLLGRIACFYYINVLSQLLENFRVTLVLAILADWDNFYDENSLLGFLFSVWKYGMLKYFLLWHAVYAGGLLIFIVPYHWCLEITAAWLYLVD